MSVVPFLGVVAIGHVNHGKTALVRALTGVETDRLPEEKARGMSIALGFAWRAYPEGGVDFLDAPGHEDFIRAMVMGAAGARTALLVVSASEGIGRQTREHLQIAGLLGLEACLVAVTKADLVPASQRPALQGTRHHGSRSGQGEDPIQRQQGARQARWRRAARDPRAQRRVQGFEALSGLGRAEDEGRGVRRGSGEFPPQTGLQGGPLRRRDKIRLGHRHKAGL
ncbi:MAG: GTP-binding protein, partial [Phenylobacterium sp.]